MAKKVYLQNNTIRIDDTVQTSLKPVFINPGDAQTNISPSGVYYIHSTLTNKSVRLGLFNEILDSGDNNFSTEADWQNYLTELINFNSGGGRARINPDHLFADAAARDAYFPTRQNELRQAQTEIILLDTGTIQLWVGETDPTTYSATNNWLDEGTIPTAAQIKTLYESNSDTNDFTDSEKSAVATSLQGAQPGTSNNTITFTRENGTTFNVTLTSAQRPLAPDPAGGAFLDLRPQDEDWDASLGTFPSGANAGYTYIVETSGTVDSISFNRHDLLIALVNSPSTTTYAGNWQKVQGGVHTWGGLTGVISDQNIIDKLNRLGYSTTSTYAAPSVHNFSTNIPSRVDLNTDLNQQFNFTFDITNRLNIQSFEAIVTNGDNITLPNPTSDGVQTLAVNLSGIDSSTSKTVTITLRVTDTQGNTHDSNTVNILIQNLATHEQTHFGHILSAEDETDINFASDDIEARDNKAGNWVVSGIPSTGLHRIYWAVPTADGSIARVSQGGFTLYDSSLASGNQFTLIANVTISGNTYNVLLLNETSAVNQNYNGTTLTTS